MKPLSLSGTRRALEPALRRLLHVYWRFARAMTLGVRAPCPAEAEAFHPALAALYRK